MVFGGNLRVRTGAVKTEKGALAKAAEGGRAL
jgi:hypothetical protein